MNDELLNNLIPIIAVVIFLLILIVEKIKNPKNQKSSTIINASDVFAVKYCPKCKKKLGKKWKNHIMYGTRDSKYAGYEKKVTYYCKYCKKYKL